MSRHMWKHSLPLSRHFSISCDVAAYSPIVGRFSCSSPAAARSRCRPLLLSSLSSGKHTFSSSQLLPAVGIPSQSHPGLVINPHLYIVSMEWLLRQPTAFSHSHPVSNFARVLSSCKSISEYSVAGDICLDPDFKFALKD